MKLSGSLDRISRCALLIAIAVFPTAQICAHEIRPAFLKIVESGPRTYDVTFKQPQIQGRFLDLEVVTNCPPTADPITSIDASALKQAWEIRCKGEDLARIDIPGLQRTMIDTLVNIHYADGRLLNHLITPTQSHLDLSRETPWLPVYFVMGMEHLLMGFDHLLFIVVLMFVVRGAANLVKAVTSFTLAHSITLGLSAFDIITVSQAPVEATIALSIVILSLQAFRPGEGNPWPVAFVFGLLHGLGFAGALSEIGLPEDAALWALLFFNIGIEVGQLAIIALMLAIFFTARALVIHHLRLSVPAWARTAPLFLSGSIASYWLIQRTSQIIF